MKEHTLSILQRMLSLLGQFTAGDCSLKYLVDSLEGSLSAIEEDLPESFYNDWYERWGELDMYLGLGVEEERGGEIKEKIRLIESQVNLLLIEMTEDKGK